LLIHDHVTDDFPSKTDAFKSAVAFAAAPALSVGIPVN